MALYVVRHAVAEARSVSSLDDMTRPLDALGRRQAQALGDALADSGITRLISSPAMRCQTTLEPLAERLGVDVETDDRLYEYSVTRDVQELLSEIDRTAALCSHGDVIPALLRALEANGTRLDGDRCEKGSVWVLDGTVATYRPPPC